MRSGNQTATSPGNILGEDIMDRKIRADIIKELNVIYSKAHNDATALRNYYVLIAAVNRYEDYIEALNDNEEYELFNFDSWR